MTRLSRRLGIFICICGIASLINYAQAQQSYNCISSTGWSGGGADDNAQYPVTTTLSPAYQGCSIYNVAVISANNSYGGSYTANGATVTWQTNLQPPPPPSTSAEVEYSYGSTCDAIGQAVWEIDISGTVSTGNGTTANGNCTVAVPASVPTLTQWAATLLGIILVAIGALSARRNGRRPA